MQLFYDGVEVARRVVTAPLNATTGTLRLGTKEESVIVDGDYFDGILDEIYIFGRGLNRKEIIRFATTTPGFCRITSAPVWWMLRQALRSTSAVFAITSRQTSPAG